MESSAILVRMPRGLPRGGFTFLVPKLIGSRFRVQGSGFPVQRSGLENVKPSPVRDFKQV